MSSEFGPVKVAREHVPSNPESELHVKHRETARVILTNELGEHFLINTHWDPGTGLPPRWLTPGGGIDVGESPLEAAVRELREETGIRVEPSDLGEAVKVIEFKMVWADGRFETGIAHFFRYEISADFELDITEWTKDEHRDIIEMRWWPLSELVNSGALVGPPGYLEYLSQL